MELEKIIRLARKEMQEMLASVLEYNSNFVKNKSQEKLLERILFSISVIDRKYFAEDEDRAYDDNALPIGEGQTISQPSTVARMLLLVNLEERDDVLEVGTGSGWNACLIAFLVYPGNTTSIERIFELKKKAENNLKNFKEHLKNSKPEAYEKLTKINFLAKNVFSLENKKYDKIIITAGIKRGEEEKIETLALKLLKEKGSLICPYTSGPLIILKKNGKLKNFLTEEEYVFVPLLDS